MIDDLRIDLAGLQSLLPAAFVCRQPFADGLAPFHRLFIEDVCGFVGEQVRISFHRPACEYCA